jgi:hypothetical protein
MLPRILLDETLEPFTSPGFIEFIKAKLKERPVLLHTGD